VSGGASCEGGGGGGAACGWRRRPRRRCPYPHPGLTSRLARAATWVGGGHGRAPQGLAGSAAKRGEMMPSPHRWQELPGPALPFTPAHFSSATYMAPARTGRRASALIQLPAA